MYYRRSRRLRPHVPARTSGNLYYVRLKTEVGMFYKLGFTTMASVEDRLGYKGTGDEKQVDEVLLFLHFDDAFFVEQKLHSYFSSQNTFGAFSSKDFMPFFKNGQSELYAKDVLRLDPSFTEGQENQTKEEIRRIYSQRLGPSPLPNSVTYALEFFFFKIILNLIVAPVLTVIFWLILFVSKFFFKESEAERLLREANSRQKMQHLDQLKLHSEEMEELIEGLHLKNREKNEAMTARHDRAKKLAMLERELDQHR